jgi:hypothetical protein
MDQQLLQPDGTADRTGERVVIDLSEKQTIVVRERFDPVEERWSYIGPVTSQWIIHPESIDVDAILPVRQPWRSHDEDEAKSREKFGWLP